MVYPIMDLDECLFAWMMDAFVWCCEIFLLVPFNADCEHEWVCACMEMCDSGVCTYYLSNEKHNNYLTT